MIAGLPTLGARFNIDKIDSAAYGIGCWSVLWRAVPPDALRGAHLWESDTAASMQGRENVFCIAIQCADEGALNAARAALASDGEFKSLAAEPPFAESDTCRGEPLVAAGRVETNGELSADAGNARAGFALAHRTSTPSEGAPPPAASEANVASSRPAPTAPVMTFEATDETLDEARRAAAARIPTGHLLVEEKVLNDGAQKRWECNDLDPNGRLHKMRESLTDAIIVSEEINNSPPSETVKCWGKNKKEARKDALRRLEWRADVVSIRTIKAPGFRLPGVRGRDGEYEAALKPYPAVTIVYRRPAKLEMTTAGPEAIPAMSGAFWKLHGPTEPESVSLMERTQGESMSLEERKALLVLAAFARTGDETAAKALDSINTDAKSCVTDGRELSRYHGYKHQQTAAKILAIAGGPDAIAALESGLALQERYGGRSELSTRSTVDLVVADIRAAISAIKGRISGG